MRLYGSAKEGLFHLFVRRSAAFVPPVITVINGRIEIHYPSFVSRVRVVGGCLDAIVAAALMQVVLSRFRAASAAAAARPNNHKAIRPPKY